MQLLLKELPAGGRSPAVCYFELCIHLITPLDVDLVGSLTCEV